MDPIIGGKVVATLGETGGAIGLICGVLLIAVLLFLRHLMQSIQTRDKEFIRLNQDVQKILVNNTAAMITLAQIIEHRIGVGSETRIMEKINKIVNPSSSSDDL